MHEEYPSALKEDRHMNKDHIKGMSNEATGEVKEHVGRALGDKSTELKGHAQEMKGKAQQKKGDAKDALREGELEDRDRELQERSLKDR
jgi:uncharacterized protein YjbJ (UPF0337 family)